MVDIAGDAHDWTPTPATTELTPQPVIDTGQSPITGFGLVLMVLVIVMAVLFVRRIIFRK